MKKKLLPLAMLAGLAGAAGTAQAVYINSDGVGETLIYPFYSVEEGQNTYINITNTEYYKAVKVRFLEGQNSAEVLDFNLYLSPEDVWTGAIVPVEGGGAKVITRDNSCTVPWIPRPNEENEVDGVNFRTFEFTGDGGDQTVARTQEGYVEIIEMGVILDADVQDEIQHDASGMPGDCDGLRARWLTAGVTPSSSSLNFENPSDVTGTGFWLAPNDPNVGFADQADQDSEYSLGGLYGYGVLINPAEGSGSAYNAVALDQFFGAAVVDSAYLPQHTNPGTTLPSLGSAYEVAQVIDGNTIVDELMVNGWDAVSAVFMHDTLSNDFVLDAAVSADTDWVITMPTKRFYVNQGDTDGDANPALPPFTNPWSAGQACEVVGIEAWDREEAVTELTGDIDFSPRPPAGEGPDPSSICSEVNVLTFGDASAVHPSSRIQYGMPELGFENGWVRLTFSNDTVGERELESDGGVIFQGLPVTGFAVQKFINGAMEGGTLANYAWLVQHNYTRDISSAP